MPRERSPPAGRRTFVGAVPCRAPRVCGGGRQNRGRNGCAVATNRRAAKPKDGGLPPPHAPPGFAAMAAAMGTRGAFPDLNVPVLFTGKARQRSRGGPRRTSECPSRARRALLSWNPGVKNHSLYFRIVVPRNAAAPPPNGRRWMGREPSALGKRGPFGRVCRRFVKSRTLQINMRHERIARIPPERLASGAADDRGAGAGAPPRACRVFYAARPDAVQAGAPPRR